MRLTVNNVTYVDFSAPIAISAGQDLLISWDPLSNCAGFGREAFGYEIGGWSGTIPADIRHAVVQVIDVNTNEVLRTSDPVEYPANEWTYTQAMNEEDHGGVYETDLLLRVVQYGPAGKPRELGDIETT